MFSFGSDSYAPGSPHSDNSSDMSSDLGAPWGLDMDDIDFGSNIGFERQVSSVMMDAPIDPDAKFTPPPFPLSPANNTTARTVMIAPSAVKVQYPELILATRKGVPLPAVSDQDCRSVVSHLKRDKTNVAGVDKRIRVRHRYLSLVSRSASGTVSKKLHFDLYEGYANQPVTESEQPRLARLVQSDVPCRIEGRCRYRVTVDCISPERYDSSHHHWFVLVCRESTQRFGFVVQWWKPQKKRKRSRTASEASPKRAKLTKTEATRNPYSSRSSNQDVFQTGTQYQIGEEKAYGGVLSNQVPSLRSTSSVGCNPASHYPNSMSALEPPLLRRDTSIESMLKRAMTVLLQDGKSSNREKFSCLQTIFAH